MNLLRHSFLKMSGWWLSVSTLCMAGGAMGGASPCCSSPGCPVGVGGAALVGGLVALVMHRVRRTKPVAQETELEPARFVDHAFALNASASRAEKN